LQDFRNENRRFTKTFFMGSRTEKNSHFKELFPASEAGAIENARAGLGLDSMAEIAGTLNPSLRGLRGMRALVERLGPRGGNILHPSGQIGQ
jgi:hypothetical protein